MPCSKSLHLKFGRLGRCSGTCSYISVALKENLSLRGWLGRLQGSKSLHLKLVRLGGCLFEGVHNVPQVAGLRVKCIVEAAVGRSNCLQWSTGSANFRIFSGELLTVRRANKCSEMREGCTELHCRGSCGTVELSAVVYWVGQFQDFLRRIADGQAS